MLSDILFVIRGACFGLMAMAALMLGWTIGSVMANSLHRHTSHEISCQCLSSIRDADLGAKLAVDGSHMGCR